MKNTLETRLGLFVAMVVFAAFLIINTVGGLDKFRRGLHLLEGCLSSARGVERAGR